MARRARDVMWDVTQNSDYWTGLDLECDVFCEPYVLPCLLVLLLLLHKGRGRLVGPFWLPVETAGNAWHC